MVHLYYRNGTVGSKLGSGNVLTGVTCTNGPPVTIGGLQLNTEYDVYIREDCGNGDPSGNVGPFSVTTLNEELLPNALCSGALPLTCDSAVTGDTSIGLYSPGPTCGPANITSKGLWYSFTGTGDEVTLSTCGQASFDTKISVFSGSCNAMDCVGGADDQPGCPDFSSRIVFPTTSGTNYMVLLHGLQHDEGTFTLTRTCAPACSPATLNDNCATAQNVTPTPIGQCKPYTGTLVCAYASPQENPVCDQYATISDVWYSFNSGPSSSCTITVENVTSQPVSVAVYNAYNTLQFNVCEGAINVPMNYMILTRTQSTSYAFGMLVEIKQELFCCALKQK